MGGGGRDLSDLGNPQAFIFPGQSRGPLALVPIQPQPRKVQTGMLFAESLPCDYGFFSCPPPIHSAPRQKAWAEVCMRRVRSASCVPVQAVSEHGPW